MNIVFNITYSTKFGEEVSLNIPVADTDGVVRTATFKMNTNDGEHWSYRLDNLCKQGQSRNRILLRREQRHTRTATRMAYGETQARTGHHRHGERHGKVPLDGDTLRLLPLLFGIHRLHKPAASGQDAKPEAAPRHYDSW